jgi:hypothetical protein
MPPDDNGWAEYKRLVLSQLETLTIEVKELRSDLTSGLQDVRDDVWKLKVQAAGWGGAAALIVSIAMKFILRT